MQIWAEMAFHVQTDDSCMRWFIKDPKRCYSVIIIDILAHNNSIVGYCKVSNFLRSRQEEISGKCYKYKYKCHDDAVCKDGIYDDQAEDE